MMNYIDRPLRIGATGAVIGTARIYEDSIGLRFAATLNDEGKEWFRENIGSLDALNFSINP